MSSNILPTIVRSSMACGLAALGLCLTHPVQAQPYSNDYDETVTASEGDIVVTAPHRFERSNTNGAPIVTISTSRTVNAGDLDLGNSDDRAVLRDRIERAANAACSELDGAWTMGMVPATDESTTDCVAHSVHRAMREVHAEYSANY